MDLKNIMLGKISQPVRAKNHDFTHMWDIKLKLIGPDNIWWLPEEKEVGSSEG